MKWDIVIFDLDGTLLDTIEDLGNAVNYALDAQGWPLHTVGEYREMVGHGIRNLVIAAMPASFRSDEEMIDRTLASFVSYYVSHIDVHTHPYDGMVELVNELVACGTRVAVASNKFQKGAETLVSEFFPGVEFVAVLGNAEGLPLKPDAAIVRLVLDSCGEEELKAVMVGDSTTDILTAANGGIPSVAVTWGFRPETSLIAAQPTYIAHDVSGLRDILLP